LLLAALNSSATLGAMKPKRVLVTGGSGLIGAALLSLLKPQGCQIVRLVRGRAQGASEVAWDPGRPISPQAVSGFDAVVHLAGESIVGRWTEEKKRKIHDSRVQPTRNLAEALAAAEGKPSVFVSSSAIGYYGDRGDELLTEASPAGNQFLSSVCREWEAAAAPAQQAGIRTANIRTGVVLSIGGGALPQMVTPFKMFVGGKIGSGRQWWSWIHIADHVQAIWHILTNDSLQGPVNLVSPNPVTNAQFTDALAKALRRPAIFPMPAFAARLAFGEMADALLLASQRVKPENLEKSGFVFEHPELADALKQIIA
jgi:uncharacterized protein (TIGR01777 family)